jgi:aminoglycoside phosphotransferase (APT) family kinase protein
MHEGEFEIDAELVTRLLSEQLPDFAALPITRVRSTGTVNALYRLGDDLCVRLPLVERWANDLTKELAWLPWLSERLSMRIPEPVAEGHPTSRYPFRWAIYRWIEGEPYSEDNVDDERNAARDLGRFVRELRALDVTTTAPRGGRRPLLDLDTETRATIRVAEGVIDVDAATGAWERSLEAPPWDGQPVWIHTDLLRPNVLVDDGRVAAVIDFGGIGVGDPAADVIPAWSVFGAVGREVFRGSLGVDDGTWARARGYALHQAALIIPYYRTTNPDFVDLATRTVEQVLADVTGSAR